MNEFKCRCGACNKTQAYPDLKAAYMDGWNIGKNALCWECQQEAKAEYAKSVVEIFNIN